MQIKFDREGDVNRPAVSVAPAVLQPNPISGLSDDLFKVAAVKQVEASKQSATQQDQELAKIFVDTATGINRGIAMARQDGLTNEEMWSITTNQRDAALNKAIQFGATLDQVKKLDSGIRSSVEKVAPTTSVTTGFLTKHTDGFGKTWYTPATAEDKLFSAIELMQASAPATTTALAIKYTNGTQLEKQEVTNVVSDWMESKSALEQLTLNNQIEEQQYLAEKYAAGKQAVVVDSYISHTARMVAYGGDLLNQVTTGKISPDAAANVVMQQIRGVLNNDAGVQSYNALMRSTKDVDSKLNTLKTEILDYYTSVSRKSTTQYSKDVMVAVQDAKLFRTTTEATALKAVVQSHRQSGGMNMGIQGTEFNYTDYYKRVHHNLPQTPAELTHWMIAVGTNSSMIASNTARVAATADPIEMKQGINNIVNLYNDASKDKFKNWDAREIYRSMVGLLTDPEVASALEGSDALKILKDKATELVTRGLVTQEEANKLSAEIKQDYNFKMFVTPDENKVEGVRVEGEKVKKGGDIPEEKLWDTEV